MAGRLQPKRVLEVQARLEVFFTGGAAVASPDASSTVACACGDEVKVVSLASGAVLRTLAGDSEPVTALAFSPTGDRLYAASRSAQLRCWDAATGELLRVWKGHGAVVLDLAVDASGGLLAAGSADSSVRVWDTRGFYCTHVFTGHTGLVNCVAFQAKQAWLLSGGADSSIRVWDLVDKHWTRTLEGHLAAVTSLSLSPDGWRLLSASRDQTVAVWDLRSFTQLASVLVQEPVEGAVWLSPALFQEPGAPAEPSGKSKSRAGPAPAGLFFAATGDSGRVSVWDASRNRCLRREVGAEGKAAGSAPPAECRSLQLLPGNRLLASTQDCCLLLYHIQGEGRTTTLAPVRELVGNLDEVTDLLFVPRSAEAQAASGEAQGPLLAVATNSPTVHCFDTASLSCTASLTGHADTVLVMTAVPATSTGSRGLLITGSKDHSIRCWDVETLACVAVGSGHVGAVSALSVAPRSGTSLVSGAADKLLRVWDLRPVLQSASERPQTPLALRATAVVAAHDKDINAVAVSPNDALVCSASQDRTGKVWRLPHLVEALVLRGHRRGIWAVAFSPVDQVVATGAGDATARLWSLADGQCLRTLEGHAASVLRVAFVTAGSQVISTGADGILKLWSSKTGECTASFDEHEGKVWALSLDPEDDARLATGGADSRVNLWRDATAEAAAQERVAADASAQLTQQLANALQGQDYAQAAAVAFELGHARRLLAVVQAVLEQGPEQAQHLLSSLVGAWGADRLQQALGFVREWNTNARTCHEAQALLQAILLQHPPETLLAVPGISSLAEGIIAYSERHASRAERLHRASFLLDYVLTSMQVLLPGDEEDGEDGSEQTTEVLPAAAPAAEARHSSKLPPSELHPSPAGAKDVVEEAAIDDVEGGSAPVRKKQRRRAGRRRAA